MSMLSSQVDELRELATRYDELQVGAVRAVTMPSNMGSILREAADTIWQLRDDLQRANDAVRDAEHEESRAWDRVRKAECDNAKLRDELDAAKHDLSLFSERIVELGAENAKLRELVADALLSTKDYAEKHGGPSNAFDASDWRIVHLRSRGRDLGVEVDE